MGDTQCRKWQITINNPQEKGLIHDKITEELQALKSIVYYCMADELGQTHHTHIYCAFSSAVRFSTLKARFPEAHLEAAKGTSVQNREYIQKTGKWENDAKHGTKIPGTFEEWGEIPAEQQGSRTDLRELYEMVKAGASNYEIMEQSPRFMMYLDKIDRARQTVKAENFQSIFRELEVIYLYGDTGVGKTKSIFDKYGFSAVYRVTDYDHAFDGYKGEDVLVLDEYREQFKIHDLLNFLDGYPLSLPCRYANKQACYTKVYIISNIPLEDQYPNLRIEQPATWEALMRRIHKVEFIEGPSTFGGI